MQEVLTMKSLSAILTQLSAMLGTHELTERELDFINSVWERSRHGVLTNMLSGKQREYLERMYCKYFGDQEAA